MDQVWVGETLSVEVNGNGKGDIEGLLDESRVISWRNQRWQLWVIFVLFQISMGLKRLFFGAWFSHSYSRGSRLQNGHYRVTMATALLSQITEETGWPFCCDDWWNHLTLGKYTTCWCLKEKILAAKMRRYEKGSPTWTKIKKIWRNIQRNKGKAYLLFLWMPWIINSGNFLQMKMQQFAERSKYGNKV